MIEPPNVTTAQGNELEKLEGTTATFEGYLRVWNEGHYKTIGNIRAVLWLA